jgi:hypothetical protein
VQIAAYPRLAQRCTRVCYRFHLTFGRGFFPSVVMRILSSL